MAQPTRSYQHVHEVPQKPLSMHALICLQEMATALASTAPSFAGTFYGGPPPNAYDPILTVVIDHNGHHFTTAAGNNGDVTPAEAGRSAHNTLERNTMLAPLNGPAQDLQSAVLSFPALCGQRGTRTEPNTLLSLSFHMDEKGCPFFHLLLAGASYSANLHSRTPEELVLVESWRFNVLAYGPVWDIDVPIRRWMAENDQDVVVAPDSAQARLLFAARAPSRTHASRILFTPRLVPLWTYDDSVESERLVRNLFAPSAP